MKKYKALFIDYDGTTATSGSLNQINLPSKKVIQAVSQAQERAKVCIITARTFENIKPALSVLNLNSYAVLLNGAQIINASTLKTIWKQPLSKSACNKILVIGRKYKLSIYAANDKKDLTIKPADKLSTEVLDIYFKNVPINKIPQILKALSSIPNLSIHRVETSAKNSDGLDITHLKATKQHALSHVLKLLKIKKSQAIGVGDSYNDYPLLMASGLKVAMGNAINELKEIADYIAPSVEDDGLVRVIEKYIL